MVTTGTGSGKTECFLFPVLDHCRRQAGAPGVKAILVYPMNALAADQARRIAQTIDRTPALRGRVTAGSAGGTRSAERRAGVPAHRAASPGQLRRRAGDRSRRVAQVSDLWFTFRTQAVWSIMDEVSDFLTERELGFDRAERLAGRSGRGWTVDFHVRTARRSSLVQVLSTGSRAAAHRVSEHVLATWHDLNHLAAGPEALAFVSLFDDLADVWTDEDFRLVEPLSTVSRWSRPDEFAAVLRDVA